MELCADLVLEGGGVKGIALVGALEVLEQRGYRFNRVAGTSAGAIVGALIAAGVPAKDLVSIIGSIHYPDFRDGGRICRFRLGQLLVLLLHKGIYRGDHLREWLQEQLDRENVRTFGNLQHIDVERQPKPQDAYKLMVTASDISHGRLRLLPRDYHHFGRDRDSQSVVDAVRASMSFPFFYRPVCWRTVTGQRVWLVDGGMLSNFPITVFDVDKHLRPRWPTLGIKLSSRTEVLQGTGHGIFDPVTMGVAMVKTMIRFYDHLHVDSGDAQARTIFVDTGGISAIDFNLDKEQQRYLYHQGRKAATEFLDGNNENPAWDFEAYIAKFRPEAV